MRNQLVGLGVTSLLAFGCANDPMYLPSEVAIDAGQMRDMEGNLIPGKSSLMIPVNLETMKDAADRMRRQALIDPMAVIPYVAVDDLEISVEWTIHNLDTMPGTAKVQLDGANQFFKYDPTMVVLSMARDAPPTPGLGGDIPLDIPAGGTLSGLFTEYELKEAAIDLDQITRGNFNPFRATLTISKNAESYAQLKPVTYDMNGLPEPQEISGVTFPREAFPALLEIDLVFKPDRHMTLDYTVRVRDVRTDIVNEYGVAAMTDPVQMAKLEPFAPALFMPPPPM